MLEDLRIIELSFLGGGGATQQLADLGADIIKIEPPAGDYVRDLTWPIVEGVSLMHLHINRGKRSVCLDMKTQQGRDLFDRLLLSADVLVGAMRPGALERLGYSRERLTEMHPALVVCSYTGYGATGPYREMAAHGIAFDTFAGIVDPGRTPDGFPFIPEHVSIGTNVGSFAAALAILAAVRKAEQTGKGSFIDMSQSEVAVAVDWLRNETWRAYGRPESDVTGNKSDNYERRAPGTGGMTEGVRYQIYDTKDGAVLFMASERKFWKNFCECIERTDLFERWPGAVFGDHAKGNMELRTILRDVFGGRSTAEWIQTGLEFDFPIAPVNTPASVLSDPQFVDRVELLSIPEFGAEMVPFPALIDGSNPKPLRRAPRAGEHSREVLEELGCSGDEVSSLIESGVVVQGE